MFNDFAKHTFRNKAQRFCVILSDDQIWTSLQVGNLDEKNTEKIQGGTTFEESISLLIYDLANDKVRILSYRFARDGHVSGQKQKHFSPLGNKLHFHVNCSKKNILYGPLTWPPCHVVANQEYPWSLRTRYTALFSAFS